MSVTARLAAPDDVPTLERLYRLLEAEMSELSPMWRLVSGLSSLSDLGGLVGSDRAVVVIGLFDGLPFGFLIATIDQMLPAAGDEPLGSIRYVFVDPAAREVGIGEAMADLALAQMRGRGVTKFDAHVLPGHRLAKNFFEQNGFSARHIIMHHDDLRR